MEKLKIFSQNNLYYLPDAILKIENLKKYKNTPIDLGLADGKRIILSAGRLTRQKNFSYLIEEFSEFLKSNNDFVLMILGEGEEKKKLIKLIDKKKLKDKIFLLGFKKNVFNYMKKSEVFILSSLWEEVGFVIVEAAMCNTYIISSDCPNGPREFLNDGKNGLLFKNNLNKSLLNTLNEYCKLDKNKIFNDKVLLKKNASKFTMFQHYLVLNGLLKI